MKHILWELPVPSSALTRGPNLSVLLKRQCEISFYMESESHEGCEDKISIFFDGVEVYKCTYMTARSVEMINLAYDKLVQLDRSSLLLEASKNCAEFYRNRSVVAKELKHLMICFDDGPCYEFVCLDYSIKINPISTQ